MNVHIVERFDLGTHLGRPIVNATQRKVLDPGANVAGTYLCKPLFGVTDGEGNDLVRFLVWVGQAILAIGIVRRIDHRAEKIDVLNDLVELLSDALIIL